MRTYLTITAIFIACLVSASGCVLEPRHTLGEQCALNSECQAPLVCRLSRCRNECLSTRDCGLGLRCVLAPDGLGVCQLPDETECGGDAECPESLTCSMDVGCTNACDDAGDGCVAGAACVTADGKQLCSEAVAGGCVYNSDCDVPMVCDEGRCVTECADDVDCDDTDGLIRECVAHTACGGVRCACRVRCHPDDGCPLLGTECVDAVDGNETQPGTCERIGAE